ncbi:hypothetical protein FN846DRAFT_103070 [Sphaerosporella brunnea]|uniref:DNA replication factor Cdt1 C-terminal domain-containing protein n=1 Tax=Sphaerosporella brunnea TaxID=1250544 RepID=A0A5J5F9B2_9PEZI|nr:hypothetical protein FN846DRAFT_103070 [Sphaerosporella brunnea]
MPPKRKAAAATAASQRTLHSFATTSKTTVASTSGRKGVKRKLEVSTEKNIDARPVIVQDGDEDVVVVPMKRIKTSTVETKQTPAKPKASGTLDSFLRSPAAVAVAATTTPTTALKKEKKAAQLPLDKFVIKTPQKTSSLTQRSGNSPSKKDQDETKQAEETVEEGEGNDERDDEKLPESLASLITLHGALLTSLLLHRAQNSSGVFPSFAAMKPHIERLTGKRVSMDEIRRIVFLSHYNSSSSSSTGLHLVDYGAGKVCIKFVEAADDAKLVHSETLKRSFTRKAHEFWTHLRSDDVPLAQITEHIHKTTINAVLHGKSQRLIKELKATPTKSTLNFTAKKPGTPSARGNSLLDRIRAKAAAAEKSPSSEELVRRAAEGRVREVTEILRSYRAKGDSVGLRAAVDNVRESVKNPIGSAEAEMAVRLVGQREGWCSIREVGGVGAVVFHRFEGDASFA